jgi:ribosome-associated translation inhibitor RaiA
MNGIDHALQVTFRHMPPSDPLREAVEQKFLKLKQKYPDATGHVVLDMPEGNHHHKGEHQFRAQLEVKVAQHHLLVSAECCHEDAYVAARDCFEKAKKQLESKTDR